ncbi:MAG: sulfate adenylyltransferase subunit CysD [Myxococcales bacterium]|nr:sulfate adenylyltransferase subunit CysD [Myxococcales bacterium]
MAMKISALDRLESEGIHILREVAAEGRQPVILFSGGKDSICVLRLAEKAFRPAKIPFKLLHVDTGHNFPEVIDFRDRRARELGADLMVASVETAMLEGLIPQQPVYASRNRLQIPVLLKALADHKIDIAVGGARRDEEKARAKERIFSFRDAFGQWDPRRQRPEPWDLYNAELAEGEQLRVFPLSNWTELDVWSYIRKEQLEVPSIYFAHEREVVARDDQWLPISQWLPLRPGEKTERHKVRVRTVGDMPCTGMFESKAETLDAIVSEVASATVTERGARADDKFSETAMEDRKREGYF